MELPTRVQKLLEQRYLQPNENWEQLVERVVINVCANERQEFRNKVKDDIYNRVWLPNSPCLVNAGLKNNGLMACFVVGPTEDTLEHHVNVLGDIAAVGKFGGGCGFTGTFIRAEGSPVAGSAHGFAYGPNNWAIRVNDYLDMITQGGFRKMALMYTMRSDHPDLEKFIDLKQNRGENFATRFNQSVMATEKFMKLAVANPDGEESRLLKKVAKNAWNNGEPGLLFYDNINQNTPYKYAGESIEATNPCGEQPLPPYGSCIGGRELVSTEKGIRFIKDVNGHVVSQNRFFESITIPSKLIKQGKKETVKVTLEGGLEIKCTPDHLFITNLGEIEAQNLVKEYAEIRWMRGNPFASCSDDINNTTEQEKLGILLGWIHGDGWITDNTIGISFNNNDGDFEIKDKILEIYHNYLEPRKPLKDDEQSYQEQTELHLEFVNNNGIHTSLATDRRIPNWFYTANRESQIWFLRALFTADAGIGGKAKSQIHFATSSEIFAKEVQKILSAYGIFSRRYKTEFKKSNRNPQYKIHITKESARRFMSVIGFLNSKNEQFNWDATYYNDPLFIPVESVEEWDNSEVYDLSLPYNHTFFVNGILVHNCNLGSINVSHEIFFNKDGSYNFDELGKAVELIVQFLDNVGTANRFPNEKFENWYKEHRPVGVGIMGLADALINLQIRYGSRESLRFVNKLTDFIYNVAKNKSKELGKERGIPEACKSLPEPRRNITLLSIAPTGSIAFIANCSHGIEPVFSPVYERIDERGESYLFEHPERFNDYFVTAINDDKEKIVSWKEHINIQSAVQQHVDSGVSKTINFSSNATVDDIYSAMLYAWATGCKGITVYRSGSRELEVLKEKKEELKENVNNLCPVCEDEGKEIHLIVQEGCERCPVCGYSLCSVA